MRVQVEVSLYPLMTDDIANIIHRFCNQLQHDSLEIHTGPMSTFISGESESIFSRIQHAFEIIATDQKVVMTLKCSNACPEPKSTDDDSTSV